MRQIHHPMLANATLSDLDVVFVGTASCSPGVTRGVSCTALRLNWRRRRKAVGSAEVGGSVGEALANGALVDGKYDEGTDIGAGGTWLFDCGESTQVRFGRKMALYSAKHASAFYSTEELSLRPTLLDGLKRKVP